MKFNVYSKEKHTKYLVFVNTVTSMPNISKSVWGITGIPRVKRFRSFLLVFSNNLINQTMGTSDIYV